MHALFVLLIALFVFAPTASAQTPAFERERCPRTMPAVVTCGYLTVPEDRSNPASPTIRLAVAVFHARNAEHAPDPILFLDGGPGSRTVDAWSGGLDSLIDRLGIDHDVIVFDQRGMGYSEPALTCPEQLDPGNADWFVQCRDRLTSEGVNLAAYTTRESASDAAELVKALGYTEYNVWGGSYGSSLALALLRDHPEGILSVVVTALQPPDLQASLGPMVQRTLNLLSDQCAADPACSEAFPGSLSDKVAAVVEQLDESPYSLELYGQMQTLDGATLVGGLGQLFKDVAGLSNAPALFEALSQQQYQILIPYAYAMTAPPDPAALPPTGAYYSIRCTDSILAATPERLEAALDTIDPAFRESFRDRTQIQIKDCQMWGAHVPTADEMALPVSDVPVLIVNGEFDPFSSPEAVASTLENLPNGRAYWIPGYGHGVNVDACAQSIVYAFVTYPSQTPDSSCIEQVPHLSFQIP